MATPPYTDLELHGFRTLPQELKLEIMRYRLLFPFNVTTRSHSFVYVYRFLNIALVSKELYCTATQIYYRENTFSLAWRRFLGSGAVFSFPRLAVAQLITKLEVHIEILTRDGPMYEYMMRYTYDKEYLGLSVLARPRRAIHLDYRADPLLSTPTTTMWNMWNNRRGGNSSWGKSFTSLQHLRVVLNLPRCFGESEIQWYSSIPQETYAILKAKEVDVDVVHEHCISDTPCAAILKGAIVELFHTSGPSAGQ